MGIKLLLDEDCQAKALVTLFRSAGHDVKTVGEEGLKGFEDSSVLAHAHKNGYALLTRNAVDFRDLHDNDSNHSGILAIFQGSDPSKNMSYSSIVRAISNIEANGLDLSGQFVVLNAWSY